VVRFHPDSGRNSGIDWGRLRREHNRLRPPAAGRRKPVAPRSSEPPARQAGIG